MKPKTKISKTIKTILNIILVITLCYSTFKIGMWFFKTKKDEANIEKLKEEVFVYNDPNKQIENTVNQQVQLDFDRLHQLNKDIKGWIEIEKLNINYPILQANDNEYYLKRDYNKQKNISGSIFLDYRNNEFEDKNTVLYGHNMKNGSMFGNLKKIINQDVKGDLTVCIESKNEILKYKIFSCYIIKPEEFKLENNIKEMKENSKINFEIDIEENSNILTLVTCSDLSTQRVIVHAFLEERVGK